MRITKKNKELQMERLMKDSVFPLEKRGKTALPKVTLIDGHGQIRDTYLGTH